MNEPDWYQNGPQDEVEELLVRARMCRTGFGVPQDFEKAKEWYIKAADRKSVEAIHEVWMMYHDGIGGPVDYASAGRYYNMYNINQLPEGYRKAAVWYEDAAEKGNREAQYKIGFLYHAGWGVPMSWRKAAEWWQKAVDQGHIEACKKLGTSFLWGEGIPKDRKKAKELYQRALELGADPQSVKWELKFCRGGLGGFLVRLLYTWSLKESL